ncbi:MAG TPA: hypothetical protein VFN50_03885, partial [Acidimicrobiales bacterium]|nr:hypothetical protein [Acidimicrobiales bacterium]
MLFAVFMVCVIDLALSTIVLLLLGTRLRFTSRVLGILFAAACAYGAGWLVGHIWDVAGTPLRAAEVFVFAVTTVVVLVRGPWNPPGQLFFGGYVAAALAYLAFAGGVTVAGGLSLVASIASAFLFVLEAAALFLTASFAFETCDVI